MERLKVRLATLDDLASVIAIQEKCPEAAVWRLADYRILMADPGGKILVAELPSVESCLIAGFTAFYRIIDEVEIRNMAVDPVHQRQGIGRALLLKGRDCMVAAGAKRVFLEVRPSNRPALALYTSLGFVLQSTRKNYYQSPPEDALVLALDLNAPSDTKLTSNVE